MSVPQYYAWESSTLVEVGSGCRTFVPARFMEMGSRRVAMITDKGLVTAGVADMVKEVFEAQGTPLIGVYDSVEQDASTANINDCAHWFREMAGDGLLAVGGGSVLDVAKSMKVMLGLKVMDIKELLAGNMAVFTRPLAMSLGIPHISIPTTAGTGAEVSAGAVIYNEAEKVKATMAHCYMNSDYAFLDPDLTVSLPPKLTAETGFDALSHCIEGFFSPNANSMSDGFLLHGVRLIHKNLPLAVQDGRDIDARTELLVGSCIGITGFVNCLGAVPIHNFAHAVGGKLRIPHGEGNAVYVPIVMKHFSSYYQPRVRLFASALDINTDGMSEPEVMDAVINEIIELQKKCNVSPTFSIELTTDELKQMHQAVKQDPASVFLPVPDEVIDACLRDSFAVKS